MVRSAPKPVVLSAQERQDLEERLGRGRHLATHFKRLQVLRLLDMAHTHTEITTLVGCSMATVGAVAKKWRAGGLDEVLKDQPRSGRPPKLDPAAQAMVAKIAASPPPKGHDRWTHELIKEHLDALGKTTSVSPRTIGRILNQAEPT